MTPEQSASRPPIDKLFPVSEKAASVAFRVLLQEQSTGTAVNTQIAFSSFRDNNPDLFDYFAGLAQYFEEALQGNFSPSDYLLGTLLGYTALKIEAYLRGGTLPKISSDTIFAYTVDEVQPAVNQAETQEAGNTQGEMGEASSEEICESIFEAFSTIKTQRIKTFLENEPGITSGIKNHLDGSSQDKAGAIIVGLYDVYSIFQSHHQTQALRGLFRR